MIRAAFALMFLLATGISAAPFFGDATATCPQLAPAQAQATALQARIAELQSELDALPECPADEVLPGGAGTDTGRNSTGEGGADFADVGGASSTTRSRAGLAGTVCAFAFAASLCLGV